MLSSKNNTLTHRLREEFINTETQGRNAAVQCWLLVYQHTFGDFLRRRHVAFPSKTIPVFFETDEWLLICKKRQLIMSLKSLRYLLVEIIVSPVVVLFLHKF